MWNKRKKINLSFLFLFGFCGIMFAANNDIVINEVMANAANEDTGEFIELYNTGTSGVDVNGWLLHSTADTNDYLGDYTGANDWGAAGTTIPIGGYAICVDSEYAGEYNTYLNANADPAKVIMVMNAQDTTWGLTNAAQSVILDDNAGYISTFTWTSDTGDGISWEKIVSTGTNDATNWSACTDANGCTPGILNSVAGAAPGPTPGGGTTAKLLDVVINEVAWMGTAANSDHEWMELFNNTTAEITLTDWTLTNEDNENITFTSSHKIPTKGYFLLEVNDSAVDDITADFDYSSFNLDDTKNTALTLKDSAGTTIDSVSNTSGWFAGNTKTDSTMERVNTKGSGTSSSNWGTNDGETRNGTDADGNNINGTPKAQNSTYSIAEPGTDFLKITQSPFSPYDDSPEPRKAKITYNTSATSKITMKIYNVKGNVVKTLIQQQDGGTNKYEMWDGKDDDGNIVPVGVYVVHLEATDRVTGSVEKKSKTIVVGREF